MRAHDTLYYFGNSWLAGRWNGKQSRRLWVGFYTKYGDGGVDLRIADLMKSRTLLGLFKVESILTASPTDGLFDDDRTDEDQLSDL
jgi:NAD+ synthase